MLCIDEMRQFVLNLNKLVIIKNFLIMAKPLYELLKKNTSLMFSLKGMKMYEYLKSLLILLPILSIYSLVLERKYIVMLHFMDMV